tara:strand:+ start:1302 stop:1664 length:363 start_codon:yes stop_codon:yes gene_type:complete
MTIATTQVVDDTFKTITSAKGVGSESEQLFVDTSELLNATSEPKVSIANIEYEIIGTGNITLFYKNDTTKQVIISGRGNYGLKPGELKIKDTIGDVLLTSDSNVTSYNIILETHKEAGFN